MLPGYLFAACVTIVVLFQFALIIGAPWGHLAMGGRYPGQFPPALRVAAFVQSVLLTFLALIVLTKAGIMFPDHYASATIAIWVVTIVSGLSLIMNLATPSKWERILWAPIAFTMLMTSGWLALKDFV